RSKSIVRAILTDVRGCAARIERRGPESISPRAARQARDEAAAGERVPLGPVGARERDQQAHAEAGRALADVVAIQVPCAAGDIQVSPRRLADEVRQERPADD